MKKVIIFFLIGVFLFIVAKYFYENSSPFNLTEIQTVVEDNKVKSGDWDGLNTAILELVKTGRIIKYLAPDAYIEGVIIAASIFCIFVSIHLVIDKIFFKDFYETASLSDAFRRGLLLSLTLYVLVYLKLYSVEVYILLLMPIFVLLLEVIYTIYIRPHVLHRVSQVKEFNKQFAKEQEERTKTKEIKKTKNVRFR